MLLPMWPKSGSKKMLTSGFFVYHSTARSFPSTARHETSTDIMEAIDEIQRAWSRGEKVSMTQLDDALEEADSKEELTDVIRQLVKTNLELKETSLKDPLTRLDNRRALDEKLPAQMNRLRRQKPPGKMAIFMIDGDHFKRINDTLGHPMGDIALKGMARIIKSKLREYDIVARYGGEEFVAAVETDKENAMKIAELLRVTMEQELKEWMRIHCDNEEQKKLVNSMDGTISMGVNFYDPSEREDVTPEQLIAEADYALYAAKQTRNAYRIYESEMKKPESDEDKLREIMQKPKIAKTLKTLEDAPTKPIWRKANG